MFAHQVLSDLTVVVKAALIIAMGMVYVRLLLTTKEKQKVNAIVKTVLLAKDVKGRYAHTRLVVSVTMLVVVFEVVANAAKATLVVHVVKDIVR